MTRLRIGVQIGQQHADYSTIRETVLRAERIGVDIVYNYSRLLGIDSTPYWCYDMIIDQSRNGRCHSD